LDGSTSDAIMFAAFVNYFFTGNLAMSVKGDGDFSISNNTQLYALQFGPMFAFDNNKFKSSGFETIMNPVIGISA